MENRPLGPEPGDQNTESIGAKKKRTSRLAGYLSNLRGKEASGTDVERTEVGADKSKRVSRLLRRLFPSVVERPAHMPKVDTERQYDFDPDTWFSWGGSMDSVESPATVEGKNDDEPTVQEAKIGQSASEDTPPVAPLVMESATSRPSGIESPSYAQQEVATPAETSENQPPDEPIRPIRHDSGTPETGVAPPLQSESAEPALPQGAERELVIERRGSNILPVALVAAEYIGRKRADKKLENRLEKKVEPLAEEQQRSKRLQGELEQLVVENKQQIEQLKAVRTGSTPEREPVRIPEQQRNRESVTPAVSEIGGNPRKTEIAPAEKMKPMDVSEAVKPQNIAERVADAAEHDVPVERAFERSHEVKDDVSVASGAASIGAVMAASPATVLTTAKRVQAAGAPKNADSLPFAPDTVVAQSYRQAMKMGFWSAVCLMILGVIAYLMVRYI